jgi:hypothetical protein
MVLKV